MKEAIVEHDGYRIRVRTRGPARGPHAIVLPGMGETGFAIAPQMRALRTLGYTTHLIELPGFGLSPALRKESGRFIDLADLVLAVTKELGIESALILGHSLGGGIALHMAVRRPAFVTGLILLAPVALGRSLVWTYKLFCLPLIGRALLRPYRHGSRRFWRSSAPMSSTVACRRCTVYRWRSAKARSWRSSAATARARRRRCGRSRG